MEILRSRGPVGICGRRRCFESYATGISAFAPTTEVVWKRICSVSLTSKDGASGTELGYSSGSRRNTRFRLRRWRLRHRRRLQKRICRHNHSPVGRFAQQHQLPALSNRNAWARRSGLNLNCSQIRCRRIMTANCYRHAISSDSSPPLLQVGALTAHLPSYGAKTSCADR